MITWESTQELHNSWKASEDFFMFPQVPQVPEISKFPATFPRNSSEFPPGVESNLPGSEIFPGTIFLKFARRAQKAARAKADRWLTIATGHEERFSWERAMAGMDGTMGHDITEIGIQRLGPWLVIVMSAQKDSDEKELNTTWSQVLFKACFWYHQMVKWIFSSIFQRFSAHWRSRRPCTLEALEVAMQKPLRRRWSRLTWSSWRSSVSGHQCGSRSFQDVSRCGLMMINSDE